MSFLQDQPVTGTGSGALDILNVLDILKNQDLYQERLKAIQDATKALNDGKWVKATVEQANDLMEAAKASKDKAEQEIKEEKQKLQTERKGFEQRMQTDLSKLNEQQQKVKKLQEEVEKIQWANRAEQDRLQKEREEISSFRAVLESQKKEVEQYYQKYYNKVIKLQEIINN